MNPYTKSAHKWIIVVIFIGLFLLWNYSLKTKQNTVSKWKSTHSNGWDLRNTQTPHDYLFIGDTFIRHWTKEGKEAWDLHFGSKGAVNLGIANATTANLIGKLHNTDFRSYCPKIVFVNVGNSDILHGKSPIDVAKSIEDIVVLLKFLLPNSKIVVINILPVGTEDKTLLSNINLANNLISLSSDVIRLDIWKTQRKRSHSDSQKFHKNGYLSSEGYSSCAQYLREISDYLLNDDFDSFDLTKFLQTAYYREETMDESLDESDNVLPLHAERAFCVNLDRSRDRWKSATKVFDSQKLKVERYSAVSVDDITTKSLNMSLRVRHSLTRSRQLHEDFPSVGAIGCYLSHVSLWNRMIDENIESAFIFEDDITFKTNTYSKLRHYTTVFNSLFHNSSPCQNDTVDVLLIGSSYRGSFEPSSLHPELMRVQRPFFSTLAYFITKRGASVLLKNASPIEMQIDAYMGAQAKLNPHLGIYGVERLAFPSGNPSTIDNDSEPLIDLERKEFTWEYVLIITLVVIWCGVLFLYFYKK